jgi:DNA-binding LacI/PurR family transcriptional regulator
LPSERELTQMLGVSRNTLRSALADLDAEGVTSCIGGRSRYVSGSETTQRAGVMEHAVAVLSQGLAQTVPQRAGGGWDEYITQGAFRSIHAQGLHAIVLHPDKIYGRDLARLVADRPAGVLVTESYSSLSHVKEILDVVRQAEIPAAVYSGAPEFEDYDRVVSDHEAGAYQLTKFLLAKSRRRIFNVWPQGTQGYWYAPRCAGYERAMCEAGLEPLPTIEVPAQPEVIETKEEFDALARSWCGALVTCIHDVQPMDAVLLPSDGFTSTLAATLRLFRLEPGRDVLLAGYDNYWTEMPNRKFDEALPNVSVDKRNHLIGEELVRLLFNRAQETLPPQPQLRTVEPELVVVES